MIQKSEKSTKTAEEILEKYKRLVWPEIKKYLKEPKYPKAFCIPHKFLESSKYHWKTVKDYPERKGKYLRPTLLLLTTKSMGVHFVKTLKTSAAIQLSEEWILGHDDFEDNSLKRRGKLALHRIYGPEIAVNAGDHLHFIMWKMLIDNIPLLGINISVKILNEFYFMLSRTITGQGVEIKWTQSEIENFTDEQWYFVADGKTSYYTIALPMRLGAIIGGGKNSQLELLADFGKNLGRCFQLVDDILDITSDFKGLKQKGNDIYEGKRTLILGHLLRNANVNDKRKIVAILKKNRDEIILKEVEWVIGKMHKYGSIIYAKKKAAYFKGKAEEIFENNLKFLSKQPFRNELKEIMRFILERDH